MIAPSVEECSCHLQYKGLSGGISYDFQSAYVSGSGWIKKITMYQADAGHFTGYVSVILIMSCKSYTDHKSSLRLPFTQKCNA